MLEHVSHWFDSPAFGVAWVLLIVRLWHRVLLRRPRLMPWLRSATLAYLIVDGLVHNVAWIARPPWSWPHRVVDWALTAWLCVLACGDPGDWLRRGARRARAALTSVEAGRLERETREAFT